MIEKYGNIFMASTFDIGYTTMVCHEIKVTDKPILQQPRRQPMHLEKKIDKMVSQLVSAGVISKCQSPWNSPLVIVGKRWIN